MRDEDIEMSRNTIGQYEKGTSGNLRGRPPKQPRKISPDQIREDFFEAGEQLITIIENGKRKLIPASVAIERQLTLKAASGDLRAIIEWKKTRYRLTIEYVKEQLDRLECVMKSEDILRKFPEDVTDQFIAFTRSLRATLDSDFQM